MQYPIIKSGNRGPGAAVQDGSLPFAEVIQDDRDDGFLINCAGNNAFVKRIYSHF